MLSFEQLKPALFKWGRYYQSNYFEFWELVNSAWIDDRLRRVENIKVASIAVRRAMINYIREVTKNNLKARFRERGGVPANIYSINSLSKSRFLLEKRQILPDISYDMKDFFNWLTDDFDERDRRIVFGVYFEGLNLSDISRELGITIQAVSIRHKGIKGKLREKLLNAKNHRFRRIL